MLRLGMLLLGASFLLRGRSAAAEKKAEDASAPDADATAAAPGTVVMPQPTLDPSLDPLIRANPLLIDPRSGTGHGSLPPRDSMGGYVTPGIPALGGQLTPDQLSAANRAYQGVIGSIYPGFQQQWLNTQRLASFQERALAQNARVAKRALSFHKRLIKKIF